MACDCDCTVRVWLCDEQHVIGPDENGNINLRLDPVVVDYDGDVPLAADAVPVVDPVDPGRLEVAKYARSTETGNVTHVAVCGSWLPIAGTGAYDPGSPSPTSDHVCYETSGWDFPEPFASGYGEWTVAAVDRMASALCANQSYSLCIGDAQRKDAFGPTNGFTLPDFGSVTGWSAYPTAEGCSGAIRGDMSYSACAARDSVRLLPDYPVGFVQTGTLIRLEFRIPSKAGSIGVAAWDPVLDRYLPIIGHSKPSGAVATQQSNHFAIDTGAGTPIGTWTIDFDRDGATQIEDVEFVFYAMNHNSGTTCIREDIENIRANVTGQVPGPCFEWTDRSALADWMTQRDPFSNVWYVSGTSVCTDAAVGQGASYGDLAGNDDGPTAPAVT